ncbi:MBL fold metallo-hydrolase [Acetobacterium wieringae]|uniref:MBL fold metallo-hydrolase n=1 Tax=Acetobacterium wieringae TaxID=52694 RepID=UPI002B211363|nr:MBL fold metallo-hydrolase [Acetobacterium wieringae]MEA4804592.1 MBL fold metallo-hydrolase [Acetobacterium wieringae]
MEITKNVFQLDSVKGSHVFLIKADENILIDTGMPGASKQILAEINDLGVAAKDLQKILLTHHDIDHIGNVGILEVQTGAEVWAPEADIPYILGHKNREGIKWLIQKFNRAPKLAKLNSYADKQKFGEIQIIPAPGHTPGHSIVSYRNVIFVGDLFKTSGSEIAKLPRVMNRDQQQAQKAVAVLKDLKYDWLCPSHGNPIQNGAKIQQFISQYS